MVDKALLTISSCSMFIWTTVAVGQTAPQSGDNASLLRVPVQVICLSDDDGGRAIVMREAKFRLLINFANRVYAPANIQFVFDPASTTSIKSTVLNSLTLDAKDALERAKRFGNIVAARYPGKLVVFCRYGPGESQSGQGFSWIDFNFVVMPEFQITDSQGRMSTTQLAHEIGHYLSLWHTFGPRFSDQAAAEKYFIEHKSDPRLFDGDHFPDTLPDPAISSMYNSTIQKVHLGETWLDLPRRNLMSYYHERNALSPMQLRQARWFLKKRMANRMAAPNNTTAKQPIEAENMELLSGKNCGCHVQQMTAFSPNSWSGNAQEYCWPKVGETVAFKLPVKESGRYRLVVYATLADDYGRMQVMIDGLSIGHPFDGYAPMVIPSGPIEVGTLDLSAGDHRLAFVAVGKNDDARKYNLGIDCIELAPAR